MKIGEMLLHSGEIETDQLEAALKIHKTHGIKLGSCLVKMGFVEEGKLLQLLSEQLYVSLVSTEELNKPSKQAIKALPRELVIKYHVFPFRLENNRLSIAMSDPTDLNAIDDIAFRTGYTVKTFVAPELVIARLLTRYYDYNNMDINYRYVKNQNEGKDESPFVSVSSIPLPTEFPDVKKGFIALLNVLERKGVISRQEIREELSR